MPREGEELGDLIEKPTWFRYNLPVVKVNAS